MAEPKHRGKREEEPEPLEAGLRSPYDSVQREEDLPPDEYLLQKVVVANGEHLRTMRVGLGLGVLVLLLHVTVGRFFYGGPVADLTVFLVAGGLLGAGLHALHRQLELLRRAVAAPDHFVFGPPESEEQPER